MNIKYRPEIDGLRALAVLSVIFYHAQIKINGNQLLAGGYLGVDIFFVISGYLIAFNLRRLQNRDFFFCIFMKEELEE